jgi:3-oxoacyl-[acyl-carrier-protein] synthase III
VGVGLAAPDAAGLETVSALSEAALACLSAAGRGACDLDLLIHAGVYRSDFILEPAIAALVAGEIDANAATVSGERRTLAFDVFSGGVGALAACRAAMELFAVGRKTLALITAGEVDNNAGTGEPLPYPLAESACAILLEPSDTSGLGRILQRDFPEHAAALETYGAWRNGVTYIDGRRAPDLEARFIDSLEATASELLALEGLDPESLAVVVAPQISASFLQRLEAQLGWRAPRFVDVTRTEGDLLTAGFGFGLDRAMQDAGPGDVGLILAAGSGVQTAGALYYF